jgi:hypothetical protein
MDKVRNNIYTIIILLRKKQLLLLGMWVLSSFLFTYSVINNSFCDIILWLTSSFLEVRMSDLSPAARYLLVFPFLLQPKLLGLWICPSSNQHCCYPSEITARKNFIQTWNLLTSVLHSKESCVIILYKLWSLTKDFLTVKLTLLLSYKWVEYPFRV